MFDKEYLISWQTFKIVPPFEVEKPNGTIRGVPENSVHTWWRQTRPKADAQTAVRAEEIFATLERFAWRKSEGNDLWKRGGKWTEYHVCGPMPRQKRINLWKYFKTGKLIKIRIRCSKRESILCLCALVKTSALLSLATTTKSPGRQFVKPNATYEGGQKKAGLQIVVTSFPPPINTGLQSTI